MKSRGFTIFAILGVIMLAAMIGYGLYTSFSGRGRERVVRETENEPAIKEESSTEVHINVELDEEEIPALDEELTGELEKLESELEEITLEEPPQDRLSFRKDSLSEKHRDIISGFDSESFFREQRTPHLPLSEEYALAQKVGSRFKINNSASTVKYIFTDRLKEEIIVLLRFYRKADKKEPNLDFTIQESELNIGLAVKSFSLPDSFQITAFIYLPARFESLNITSSASKYILEGSSAVTIDRLEVDTNAADGEINLQKLTVGQAEFKVNAASTDITIGELDFTNRLYISNNAAGLNFEAAKLSGNGKNIEIDQNASSSRIKFGGLDNVYINGDINLGTVSITHDEQRTEYKKAFRETIGNQDRVLLINSNLGKVELEF